MDHLSSLLILLKCHIGVCCFWVDKCLKNISRSNSNEQFSMFRLWLWMMILLAHTDPFGKHNLIIYYFAEYPTTPTLPTSVIVSKTRISSTWVALNTISLPLHNIQNLFFWRARQRKCIKRHCPDDERDIIFVLNINKKSKRMNVMCAISSYFLSHQSSIKVCLLMLYVNVEANMRRKNIKTEEETWTIHIGFGEREGWLWQWIFSKICGKGREGDREEYERIAEYIRLTIAIIVIAFHSFKKLFSISAILVYRERLLLLLC